MDIFWGPELRAIGVKGCHFKKLLENGAVISGGSRFGAVKVRSCHLLALFSKPWLLVAVIVRSSGLGAVIYEPKIQCCELQAIHS